MRKLFVLGLLLAASTGCGRSWFPHLFRGAPCNGLCSTPAPAPVPTLRNDCEGCSSSGYATYEDGQVIGGAVEGGFDPNAIILSQPAPMTGIPNSSAPTISPTR